MKKTKTRRTAFTVAVAVAVVATAFVLRGVAPELYRYIRMRRM